MAKKDSKKSKKQDNNRWFKDFKAELKKINWPNRSELLENTIVVFSMVVIVSVTICVLDLAFKTLNGIETNEVVKLKNSIVSTETDGTVDSDDAEDEIDAQLVDESTESEENQDEAVNIVISE